MIVSLRWIRDYVDLPADVDARELGERLTLTTAEVEGVTRVAIDARGLIVARIEDIVELPDTRNLRQVALNLGGGKTVDTVTGAPALRKGSNVVYAPPGAHVAAYGEVASSKVAGRVSTGMILPADSLGISMAIQEAVAVGGAIEPGEELPQSLFDDWIIEIDNKSITHRPDLWGHYGVAREIAAIYGLPLKPYPVLPLSELTGETLPEVPVVIADPDACPRYCAIVLEGVPTEPAPLWMQLRLGRVGMRPISALVDMTNYVMADLGQPMHAFDAASVDRIEVDWADDGECFKTLDGTQRRLTSTTLMIKRRGENIAIAGVMGGLETEVAETTSALLLESANFSPVVVRRAAARLGLRTDASARFEKSLDPLHARLAIQRFTYMAKEIYPNLTLKTRLSDAYSRPREQVTVTVNPEHVGRTIGRDVPIDEATALLHPLGFKVAGDDGGWQVHVPSFRATGDVSIEADVIEELARRMGYATIRPTLPRITMRRFELNALHELERHVLRYFTTSHAYNEVHGYLWYDAAWLRKLGIDPGPCLELANPAAEGLHQLRRSLIPGLLNAVARNRFYFPSLSIVELGSVFEPAQCPVANGGDDSPKGGPEREGGHDHEYRHIALVSARRGRRAEHELYEKLKGAIGSWIWQRFARRVSYLTCRAGRGTDHDEPSAWASSGSAGATRSEVWAHPQSTVRVLIDGRVIGLVSMVAKDLRWKMDEHLAQWSIVWAELRLNQLLDDAAAPDDESLTLTEELGVIPDYPQVELDFSFLVPATTPYAEVVRKLAPFPNPLLRQVRYVGSYQGESTGAGRRSLTVRAVCGHEARTLEEKDLSAFREDFERHLASCGYTIRK